MPKILYEDVIEVDERIIPFSENDSSQDPQSITTLPNGKKV